MSLFRYILVLLSVAVLLLACDRDDCVEGEGDNFSDERNTAPFHTIVTDIPMNMFLTHDSELTNGKVTIRAQENVQERIAVEVSDRTLRVFFSDCIDGHSDIDVYIQSADFREIIAGSPVKVFTERAIHSDSLRIQTLQSTNGDIFFAGNYLETDFRASGDFELQGRCLNYICNAEANISLNAFDLLSDTVYINSNSIDDARIYAQHLIEADIKSSGDVYYKGFPEAIRTGDGTGELIEDN